MKPVFADTFFYLAILNPEDAAHLHAAELLRTRTARTITTAWVLTEVGDAMAAPMNRPLFLALLERLRSDPKVTIVPPTQELFDRGIHFYSRRRDQDWSLTDCISFVVMHDHKLTDVLTGDRHFEQAGFRGLLT